VIRVDRCHHSCCEHRWLS